MKRLSFNISYFFIYLLACLPFPILYIFSDITYFVIFKIIGYRKKVIINNLKNSFPNKSDKEIQDIANEFSRYLCDLMLETFKTLTITPKSMLQHCQMTPEAKKLFADLAHQQQSILLVLGHYGNWEWAGNTFSLENKQQLYVIYHPLTNPYFDKLMYQMRSRFGTKLITMKNTFKEMLSNKQEVNATAFIADQTPSTHNAHWTTFLNQDTPVFKGTEIIAKKLNRPIVYMSINRVKRGYYTMHAEMLIADPSQYADGEITNIHTQRLEQDILQNPAIWLWSHRRWKYKKPD